MLYKVTGAGHSGVCVVCVCACVRACVRASCVWCVWCVRVCACGVCVVVGGGGGGQRVRVQWCNGAKEEEVGGERLSFLKPDV